MGVVKSYLPIHCPKCNERLWTENDWNCISIGSEVPADSSYSFSKGMLGGMLGLGTGLGWSHSKGSLKSTRIDLYQCPHCGKTVQREVNTYW